MLTTATSPDPAGNATPRAGDLSAWCRLSSGALLDGWGGGRPFDAWVWLVGTWVCTRPICMRPQAILTQFCTITYRHAPVIYCISNDVFYVAIWLNPHCLELSRRTWSSLAAARLLCRGHWLMSRTSSPTSTAAQTSHWLAHAESK